MQSLLVTGYKAHELGVFSEKHVGISWIKKTLEKRIRSYVEEGLEWVVTSGQTGVEQWAIDVVISMRESEYPELRLAVLPPFEQQEANWKDETKALYIERLAKADFVQCISKRPYENPNQLKQKNEYLVQKTDAMLVLYDDLMEGSPLFYIRAAQVQNKPIVFISPDEVEEIGREEENEF
ncbi:putative phage-like protein YoqJ [Alkalihalobacillus xiaoxiensis]|uniref:Phage-like protein YoqJ n=1 Tax=Shouchella xiaoxiensis TaxID=766895 RepID=A0ABS2SXJ1_9BACI|nr:SLOG family protein [Shouchella xiaoxiensis]MBM7840242.1 putative phage-like protein YoqJ [Shouchella xiaoxiensis]